jgi:hypothetical protein
VDQLELDDEVRLVGARGVATTIAIISGEPLETS